MATVLKYSLEKRTFLLTCYYQVSADLTLLCEEFEDHYLNLPFSFHQMISNVHHEFQDAGSFADTLHYGQPRDV